MKMRKISSKILALLLAAALCVGCAFPSLAYYHGQVVEVTGEETISAAPGQHYHGEVVEDNGQEEFPIEEDAPTPDSNKQQNDLATSGQEVSPGSTAQEELAELLETEGAVIDVYRDGSMKKAAARSAVRAANTAGTLHVGYKTFNSYVGEMESFGGSLAQLPTKTLVSGGQHTAAYCVEEPKGATNGHGYTTTDLAVIYGKDIASLIGDILANGYQYTGASSIPREEGYKWAITQIMIWQVMHGSIYRDSKTGENAFKPVVSAELEKCAVASGHYNEYYAYFCSLRNKLQTMRKIPSFAYREREEAQRPNALKTMSAQDDGTFSFTATDTNKVLSHFSFTFPDSGITTTVSGNKLKLTSTEELTAPVTSNMAEYKVQGGADSVVGWKPASSDQQTFVCADPKDDPVPAYIAVQTGEADPDNPEQPETPQWRVTVTKRDSETGTAQGDATLAGAVYGVYHNGSQLDTYVTNSFGQFTTSWYDCGEGYTLKEISPSKGYLLNPATVTLDSSAVPGETLISRTLSVAEDVIKSKIRIVKHSDKGETGIETPEEGAKFQIWLTSAGSYEAAKSSEKQEITVDKDGFAETRLNPYGTYTVHQTEGKEGTEKIPDFQVASLKHNETYSFIANNRVYEALITVMKKDAETGRMIPAPGITFQIRDVKTGEFVTQHINYPTPQNISYFQTDSQGKLCMPEKLEYGEYELVEYATAYGYVLDTTPVPFKVDGTAKEITVEKSNMPQKGIIQLEKTGEVPDGTEEKNSFTVPTYQKAGLSGVEFTVTAAEDISTPDGTLRYVMGEKIETLVTDEEGHAETQPLYLGKYWIQETKGKDGYAIDPEKKLVTLKYTNQEESVQYQVLNLVNERRELQVEKIDKQFSGRRLTGALFDLWYDKDGDKKLDKEKDELFGELTETSTGIYTLSYLPVGGFFLVETQAPALYKLLDAPEYFEVRSTDVLIKREVRNEVKTGSLKILKTAEDSKVEGITFLVSGKPLAGGTYEEEFVTDKNGEIFISELPIGEYTVSEVLDENSVRYVLPADQSATIIYGETAEVSFYNKLRRGEVYVIKTDPDYPESKLTGAKFKVWRDTNENGKYENGEPVVGVLQEDDGTYWLDGLENGSYLLREEIAPEGYLADDNYYAFTVSANKQQVEITNTPDPEAGFVNRKLLGSLTITKESTSGALLSGANFCLKNKDGEVIAEGTTDEDGKLVFDELPCGEYVYQEICAPAGYETDDTEHKVSITAEKLHVEITAVNEQTPFYVPKTGDGRMNPAFYWILLVLCTAGAGGITFYFIKEKKRPRK